MDTNAPANTAPAGQEKTNWIAASARFSAAEVRMNALNGSAPSDEEMDATGDEWSKALHSLLQTRAPDAAALREKLTLVLLHDEEDGPLLLPHADRATILADFDRIAGAAPQPVDHEPAAGKIQELALQAGHAQAAAMQALHDAGDAPEAALALGALVARLIGEMAEVASKIEAGRPLVEKAPSRLVGRPH